MENMVQFFSFMAAMSADPTFWKSLAPWQGQTFRHALIKFGGGITQMSGSIAGNTFARNRFGNYVRSRTKPVNPNSARQTSARARVQLLTEQWREDPMTDAFRTAWAVYANSVNWLNKLGESVKLTGFNHFIRSNVMNIINGKALNFNGPTDLGLPPADPTISIAISAANGMTVTFDDTMAWCDLDGAYLMITHGEPQNPTRNFFGGPWRYNGSLGGSAAAPPPSPQGPWPSAQWAEIEGQKWWAKFVITLPDGRASTPFEADPVIVAA